MRRSSTCWNQSTRTSIAAPTSGRGGNEGVRVATSRSREEGVAGQRPSGGDGVGGVVAEQGPRRARCHGTKT